MTSFTDLLNHVRNLISPFNNGVVTHKNENRYKTTYLPITDHIYFNGHSFRVRFIKEGVKKSKNFKTKKQAINFKKKNIN